MEKYTAIITEPRIHPAWKLVLNNFLTNLDERWDFIIECWAKEEREWQYFAIDWMNSWKKKSFTSTDIFQLEKLINQKSWWDSVDAIASNVL